MADDRLVEIERRLDVLETLWTVLSPSLDPAAIDEARGSIRSQLAGAGGDERVILNGALGILDQATDIANAGDGFRARCARDGETASA